MKPETSKAIRKLHALLQQVAAEVAAIRPLLEEESESREEVAEALNKRLDTTPYCPATDAADRQASYNADMWLDEVEVAIDTFSDCSDSGLSQSSIFAMAVSGRSTL